MRKNFAICEVDNMRIDKQLDRLILREGGYVNHPNDKGGPTKYGITLQTLKVTNPLADITTLKALTVDEAKQIYYQDYYLRPRINQLPNAIGEFVFDCCVNHGPKTGVQLLQSTINQNTQFTLETDGVIGSKTLEASHFFVRNAAVLVLARKRIAFYQAITKKTPSQKVFLKGWVARVREFIKGL